MNIQQLLLIGLSGILLTPPADGGVRDLDRKYGTKKTARKSTSSNKKVSVHKNKPVKNNETPSSHTENESYARAYRLPLHNNEDVDLPEWVKIEFADINAELRDKLSPIDYLEILKGEYFLFSKYPTRQQYQRNYKNDGYPPPCREIATCKKKLREILQTPENTQVFTRAYVQKDRQEGIYFRKHLRYIADKELFTHDRGVITNTPGETDSDATILTCWDPRTAREISTFCVPTFSRYCAGCTKMPDGNYAYYLHYTPAEVDAQDWSGNVFGTYLWIPENSNFQRLLAVDWNTINTTKTFSTEHPGNIYKNTKLRPGVFNSEEVPEGWFKSRESGMKELGNAFPGKLNDRGEIERAIYTTGHSEGSMLILTHTFDRMGLTPAANSYSYGINLDTLETQKTRATDASEIENANNDLMQRLHYSLNPPPNGSYDDDCNLLEPGYLERGTGSQGYAPFALMEGHFGEGSDLAGGIIGILSPNNEAYLYKWDSLIKGESGALLPYHTCIVKGNSEYGANNLIEDVQSSEPFVRHHSIKLSDDGNKAEVIIVSEWSNGRAYTTVFDLDTTDYSYTVKHRFESPQKYLCPVWVSEKQWFLEPVSDVCYHINKVDEAGKLDRIADLYVDPKQGYAIVLPNGHYAGSPQCERFLAFREGEKTVSLETLAPWKNRPAEVLEALGGNEDDIAALRETTKRWLRKLHMADNINSEAPSLHSLPSARVELPQLYSNTPMLTCNVHLKASPNKALTAVEVYAEGKQIPQEWDNTLMLLPGEEKTVTVLIPLAVGQNWLEIRPVDSMGIAGDNTKFRVLREDVTQPSELYMVALGVSDYEYDNEDMSDLRYAVKDAQDITESFRKHANGRAHTLILSDKEVFDITVLQKVKEFFAGSKMNDRVILYVAGHGFLDENHDYRYAAAGFDAERMEETSISMAALVDTLKSAPARKGLLLLDTCHSGTLGEAGEEALAQNNPQHTDTSRTKQTRGMKLRKTGTVLKTERQTKRYIEDIFTMDRAYRGINIIAGAGGAELAQEGDEWNNGVFTVSIIQTLENFDEADTNADATLSVEELQNHILPMVQKYTKGQQKPTIVAAEDNHMDIIPAHMPWLTEVRQRMNNYDISDEQKNNDWQKVREWVKSGCNSKDATELIHTLGGYNMPTDIFTSLLHKGADADFALRYAVKSGNIANMEQAFAMGASAATATECLTVNLQYKVLLCLQRHGADIKAKGKELLFKNYYWFNSEQRAQESYQYIKLILDAGVDVNTQDSNGNTILHQVMMVAGKNAVPVIDMLLVKGANINIRNNMGKRPQEPGDSNYTYLQQRAQQLRSTPNEANLNHGGANRTQLQQYLTSIQNYTPSNADMKLYKKRLTMLLPMIINGEDVNVTTAETKGNTALHYAAGMGYYDLVVWLVDNGAEINRRTNKGKTPLDCVGNDPNNATRRFLISRGAVKSN